MIFLWNHYNRGAPAHENRRLLNLCKTIAIAMSVSITVPPVSISAARLRCIIKYISCKCSPAAAQRRNPFPDHPFRHAVIFHYIQQHIRVLRKQSRILEHPAGRCIDNDIIHLIPHSIDKRSHAPAAQHRRRLCDPFSASEDPHPGLFRSPDQLLRFILLISRIGSSATPSSWPQL